jgi:hypothetical protein
MKKPAVKKPSRRQLQLMGLAMVTKKHGRLMAEDVFKDAKDIKHPLHSEFEWDEHEGWKQWNLEIARSLISMHRLELVDIKTGKSVSSPMFINIHNLPDQKGPQEYHPLVEVRQSKSLMDGAMKTGVLEMVSIVSRWTWHDVLGSACQKFISDLKSLQAKASVKPKKKHAK